MATEDRRAFVQRGPREAVEFAIRDLSAKGMRLVGTARLVERELVRVKFAIDGTELVLDATVVRTEPQRAQVALEFRSVPAEAAALIARAIADLRKHVASAGSVLVCHGDAETRAALERDILRLGRIARPCPTADAALALLDDLAIELAGALIASSLPVEALRTLVDRLASESPHVKRVLLFGEQLESIDHQISSRIDAVLRMPPRIRPLARALGIDTNDSSLALLLPEK